MFLYLKNLTPTQQIGALFVFVFGLLLLASVAAFLLSVRDRSDDPNAEVWRNELQSAQAILRTSWFMVFVFWVGWIAGDWVALTLFGFVSFFSLREFLTLS